MTWTGAMAVSLLCWVSGAVATEHAGRTDLSPSCGVNVTHGQAQGGLPEAMANAPVDLDEYLELHAHARAGIRLAVLPPSTVLQVQTAPGALVTR